MTAISLPMKARTPAPATPSAPTWDNIDPASLPEDLRKLYQAYQTAAAAASAASKLFETECNEAFDAGLGNRLAFGYKFGKLSVAIVPDAPRTTRAVLSLDRIAKPR